MSDSGKTGFLESIKRVLGKTKTSFNSNQPCSSAENFDLFCQPCDEHDKHVKVQGFCNDCQKYLCSDCVEFHKKFWATKKHVIQDKDSMPGDAKPVPPVQQTKNVCTEPCAEHPGKILEYYCASHDEFVCSVCATLGHITCGVGYIPELAKGITNSNEYGEMCKRINVVQKQFEETKEISEESVIEIEKESEAYTYEVTQLGEEIIEHVRNLVQKAVDEKDNAVNEMLVGLRSTKEQCQNMTEEINAMKLDLEYNKDSDNESFVLMQANKLKIKKAEDTLRKTQIASKPTVFHFAKNPNTKGITKIKYLGTLLKHKIIVEQLENITISTQNDEVTPWINGLEVLCDGTIAMVDRYNKSVKVYTPNKNVLEMKLQTEPWDLTEVSNGRLAVTLPDEGKIQFLTVARRLTLGRVIKTEDWCMGIAACKDKLFVSFTGVGPGTQYPGYPDDPTSQVQILNMTGQVLRRITPVWHLEYITVNPDINMVYVSGKKINAYCESDNSTGRVMSMNLNGKKVKCLQYSDKGSYGLTTIGHNRSFYICGWNSVYHITKEGTKIQTLLDQGQEGAISWSIAYDKYLKRLYLGGNSKSLTVYQLQ